MTSKQISEQIAAIRNVTAKARVSKEAAAAFLISAGIIGKHAITVNTIADINGTKITDGTQVVIESRKSRRKATASLK
jgi:hypothetical protein